MDSRALRELGFRELIKFQRGVEKRAPKEKGVYVFCCPTSKPTKVASSDIMYIGRAAGDEHHIRHSLNQYLHPGHDNPTKKRVGQEALTHDWLVSWMTCESRESTELKECQLLQRFHREHDQLPPENKIWPSNCS